MYSDPFKELLKALLAHYPKQSVEWEDPWCALFQGHWEDEDLDDTCLVNSIYINEDNELSFDLTRETWDCEGNYHGAEELEDVTWDFILDETYDVDYQEDELVELIKSLCEDLHEVVIPSSVTEISKEVFKGCTNLQKIVISEGVKSIGKSAFRGCSSLEIVHLPVGVSNVEFNSFADCKNLKAIYVPENKVDFYKERFPSDMHWLIIEEGSDFQVKAENVIAKDISFAPTLRVIVSKSETDSGILSAAEIHLEEWSKSQIIEWIIANLDTITDSKEAYNEEKDEI